jgi:hypothetical protein
MRPRIGLSLFRVAIVSGAVLATVPLTTVAFAWSQPICNPNTGEVVQPSHFADEAAYNKYLKDHPGSYEMQAGGTCATPAAQPAQVVPPTVAGSPSAPSAPSTPAGTVICVVNANDVGTTVEQRRVLDVTKFLSTHAGSFIMAAGKDCGPTYTANLPPTTSLARTANQPTTANTLVSNATTAAATAAAVVESPVTALTLAAAELDLAAEFQIVPSIPPFAGDGTTADEIVP